MSVSYKGAIHDLILELFMIKDGFTVGEKLEHLKKQLPTGRYYGASDEEIFNTLQATVKENYYGDEYNAE